jgi:hypothetical protein
LTLGMASSGPDVVCANVVATPYDHSHATIVPGAIDVLPLNVQSIVLPPFVNVHVSVWFGPVTPKLAIATLGRVTESTADADAPPYDPVMVPDIVPPTVRVEIVKGALADPAGTVTLGGTVTGSALDNDTTAPPLGAAAVRVAVPVTWWPPTTLDVLREIEESATGDAATVSIDDSRLLPLNEAVIVAVPAATATTEKVALIEPAWIVTSVCTVATAELLLDSAMLAPPVDAAAVRLTVPWLLVPAATLVAFSVTPERAETAAVGAVGDVELPQ